MGGEQQADTPPSTTDAKLDEGTRQKSEDEIYCYSCGELIKKQAVYCPHCGVKNAASESPADPATETHSASQVDTTVSDTWWYGVAVGMVLWVILVAWVVSDYAVPAAVGLLILVAWVILPVAVYFDIQYVRSVSGWNPVTFVWVLTTAVWFLNIFVGAIYLYRRHETLGVP